MEDSVSVEQLVDQFRQGEQISGTAPLGGFEFSLDPANPYVATAIHAGSRVRPEVMPYMTLSENGRFLEEDPATDEMISGLTSRVTALDSRFEYELNRPPWRSIFITPELAWGLEVYANGLPEEIHQRSLAKRAEFYRFMKALVLAIADRHGKCVVYDAHSYCLFRQIESGIASPPVFNLGTDLLDRKRWKDEIESWMAELEKMEIPEVTTTVEENRVFFGRGEFCRQMIDASPDVLTLPTEISKIYMNERTGEIYPAMVEAVKRGYVQAVPNHLSAIGLGLK